jgi:hypothetical protein
LDGFGIQVSFKTPNDTLVNVRGSDPTEFDLHLAHAVERVEQIHAAEAAFKGLAPQDLQQAAATVQAVMPGTQVVSPPAPQVPPQGGYQLTHCGRCMQSPVCKTCQMPAQIVPRSIKDGQYYIHDCPSGSRDHKGSWCNVPKN